MGWTPRRTTDARGSAAGTPSPAPRRRRGKALSEPEAQPARPRAGVNNSVAGYDRDTRPRNQTVQLGKRWSAIVTDIKAGEYTWTEFVDGLDEEELARGQLKADDGSFKGRPPSLVPREFHLACQRELKRRFQELFDKDVIKVAQEYLKMAQSPTLGEATKAKMLQYAMERVFGGIPKDVRVSQEAPWEQVLVNITSDDGDQMPDHLKRRYAGYQERLSGTSDEVE